MSSAPTCVTARVLPFVAPDDAALVRSAQAGEELAVLRIFDRYAALVRGVLRRTLGPCDDDVEDLLQDVFMAFYRSVGRLRDPAALRPFLIGIATRRAISEIRRRKVRRFLRLTSDGELPETASENDGGPEALARLYVVLDACSATDRALFVLRHIEGLELTEIAAALDVSLATAKRRLATATERIVALAKKDFVLSEYVVEETKAP